MHPEHTVLLEQVRAIGGPDRRDGPTENDSYGGSGRPFYRVSVPDRRAICRRWLALHKGASPSELLPVVESLLEGDSHEERTLAPMIIAGSPPLRRTVRPADLDRWRGMLNGWAEIDSMCQNLFSADDLLADWSAWEALLTGLSRDVDSNKRRASLVLLTGPVHYSGDVRFRDVAFANIETLKSHRPILLTKAVSWLLRSMVTRHRVAVVRSLDENEATLPKIAVRETRTKLRTGTKSGR
jgi:hypothetical protein